MAVTIKTPVLQGALMEVGQFTLDPSSIAAAAQGLLTVTINGAKVGDQIFVNAQALDNKLIPAGAKITAANTATIYLNNSYDATTAIDGASKTWDYILFHLS